MQNTQEKKQMLIENLVQYSRLDRQFDYIQQ